LSLQLHQDLFRYLLPDGLIRGSFIVLAGEGGSGKSVILAHIVRDVLSLGEPVLYLAFDDDPLTVLRQLSVFQIPVEKYCSEQLLGVIDGFSYTIRQRKGKAHSCVVDEVTPDNPDDVVNTLIKAAEQFRIESRGLVIIDSLNEVMIMQDPARFVLFVKSLRANIAKARGAVTIATLHTSTSELRNYLLLVEHLVDGIVETGDIPEELSAQLSQVNVQVFVRQIRVLKMKGTSHRQGWFLYGIDREGVKPVVIKAIKSS
jgi:KaiC/GvpD/RAD55 family RecA-like ATPase